MPLTPDELEALARKPQSVTTDAGSATQRSADDVLKLAAAAAAKQAAENGTPAIRIFKVVPPGTA